MKWEFPAVCEKLIPKLVVWKKKHVPSILHSGFDPMALQFFSLMLEGFPYDLVCAFFSLALFIFIH